MKNLNIKFLCILILICTVISSLISCESALRPETEALSNESTPEVSTESAVSDSTATENTGSDAVVTDTVITEVIIEEGKTATFDELNTYVKQYPNLETLKGTNVTLTDDEYISLCEANPNLKVITKVDFEGYVIDLSQNEVDLSEKRITDKAKFDSLLSHIPSGIKFVMCDCGYTDEEMGALRDKYTELDFAWRIYMGKWSLRTDDEAFSVMIYDDNYVRLTSEDIEVLRYCTNMYALDLGHQALTDLSVIGDMTSLRVLILADNKITDVTPLSKLSNLQYLELFVNRISDLSPLASCTELVDLNFGWNSVYDLSSIYSLEKIERLWLPTTKVSADKRAEISENFKDAQIVFEDVNSISSGWRTHERYFSMRGMFTNNKYDPNFVKDKAE